MPEPVSAGATFLAALPPVATGINALGSILTGVSGAKQARQNAEQQAANQRYARSDEYQELGQRDRQFGANLDDASRRYLASLGIDIDRLAQDDRQFAGRLGEESAQFGAELGQRDRQFGAEFGLDRMGRLDDRATQAARLQRSLNTSGLQDRAAFMLNQRLGMGPASFAQGGAAPVLDSLRGAASSYQPGQGGMDFGALRSAIGRMTSGADDPGVYQQGEQFRGPGAQYQAQRSTTGYTPTNYQARGAGEMEQEANRNQAISRYTSSNLQRNRNAAQRELGRIDEGVPSQYDARAGSNPMRAGQGAVTPAAAVSPNAAAMAVPQGTGRPSGSRPTRDDAMAAAKRFTPYLFR